MQPDQTYLPSVDELGFDPSALRRKYDAEREKRIRADGNDQYHNVTGDLERYTVDPYIEEEIVRDSVEEEIDVAIIGGGFGGMLSAARLQKAGIDNVRIIEKAGDFGGTWYWNRYPGAQCDIESYVYLPLLEEVGYMPTKKYAYGPEILEHSKRIGRHFNLYDCTYFQTQIEAVRWDDDEARYTITTDRGDVLKARFVVMSSGPLNRPKLPGIPGVEKFKGHTFHTSRWDYDYTGGNPEGGMTKLADKRIGILGTGATSIQCAPYVGQQAQHLYVFQRTPSSIDERGNSPTDPEWANSLEPGWQAARNHNFCSIMSGLPVEEDLVDDGWTDLFKALSPMMSNTSGSDLSTGDMLAMSEIADYQKMNGIRDRVERSVEDPDTAESLKPWYRPWCKRPTFNDEFLPNFNRPNVTLVDTDGQGVERITEKGVVVNGVEYELDCLIFATGFEVGTAYTRRAAFEVFGRDGVSLTDYWAGGMKTFHGLLAHGFPNCFHMGLTQTGLAPNFTFMLDGQATHIAYIVEQVMERGAKAADATPAAEADWVRTVNGPNFMDDYLTNCTPGYYNHEGRKGAGKGFLQGHYPEGAVRFYEMLGAWRAEGTMQGLDID
jgi:cyclohexanone monooxygenase